MRLVCTEKACMCAHKALCTHACTLVHLHMHTLNTRTFARKSTMRACTPAHMHAGVHTQNTSTCVPKAPAGMHNGVHSQPQEKAEEGCRIEG